MEEGSHLVPGPSVPAAASRRGHATRAAAAAVACLALLALALLVRRTGDASSSSDRPPSSALHEGRIFADLAAGDTLRDRSAATDDADDADDASDDAIVVSDLAVSLASHCGLCGHATVTLNAASDGLTSVALRYHRYDDDDDDGDASYLWTPATTIAAGETTATVSFCRMRFSSTYRVVAYYRDGDGGDATAGPTASLATETLGYELLDDGAYAAVHGTWSSELIFTYTAAQVTADDDDNPTDVFTGLVALDSEGYVVWYYQAPYKTTRESSEGETYYLVFDWIPDSYNIAVTRYIGDFYMLDPVKLGELYVITPLGVAVDDALTYDSVCEGGADNFNQIQHECRVDSSDAARGYPILTFEYAIGDTYGTYQTLEDQDASLGKWWLEKYGSTDKVKYVGDRIVRWVWDSNATDDTMTSPEVVYDMFDYFAPNETSKYDLTALTSLEIKCNGGVSAEGVDYHHGSSIAVGTDDNYLVTLRNINTVASFARNGSGLLWALSPTLTHSSSLEFADVQARFYDPHDVTQLSSDRIMLIDDGNTRANCTITTGAGCFSRALVLELDWDANVARAVWQFSYPYSHTAGDDASFATEEASDSFNVDGGSAELLDGGNYLVAFTKAASTADDDVGRRCHIFEADGMSGEALGHMYLPILPSCCDNAGHYRALSASTIFGEGATSPF